jgi:ketol-acid reductoisomerase
MKHLWKKECKFVKTSPLLCVLPKCPGSEVREEYKEVWCANIAVHLKRPEREGFRQAKAYAVATGHKAGVLNSSFVAESKVRLDGEQTFFAGCANWIYFMF